MFDLYNIYKNRRFSPGAPLGVAEAPHFNKERDEHMESAKLDIGSVIRTERKKLGISLDEAAEYANMSSCYFSKFFKKITGMNFITYVTDCKIEAAQKMLLDTDMPVINIAYELSYSETNYFSKAFKRKVGMSPTEYREIHCGE